MLLLLWSLLVTLRVYALQYVFACISIRLFTFSAPDDDYSGTYNATYAFINNGETCSPRNKKLFHTLIVSSRPACLLLSALLPSLPLPPLSPPFCPQPMTTAPPWPTHLLGHTHIDLCPKAPQTTEGSGFLGSPHLPQYPHHLRQCPPSCSLGPETATGTKIQQTCKRDVLLLNTWVLLRNWVGFIGAVWNCLTHSLKLIVVKYPFHNCMLDIDMQCINSCHGIANPLQCVWLVSESWSYVDELARSSGNFFIMCDQCTPALLALQ